jgi:hypothetical protein
MQISIALSEADFRLLVSGDVVRRLIRSPDGEQNEVQLILSDIGWPLMLKAVRDARAMATVGGSPAG